MNLTQHVKNLLIKYGLENANLLVALSGGPDSVCLLHVLHGLSQELNLTLFAAHLDHEWRAESKDDAKFCKKLCAKLAIPLTVGHASEYQNQIKNNGSKEAHARKMRQMFLRQVQAENGCQAIVLAHHADDQLETFFIRLARGASLAGLCAMQELNPPFFRPMLGVPKTEIFQYISKPALNFVVDATNDSDNFLRNRIRKYLLPKLAWIDARFEANVAAAIKNLNVENEFIESCAQNFLTQFPEQKINLPSFFKLHQALQNRVLIKMLVQIKANFTPSHALLSEILKFLNSVRGGKHLLGQSLVLVKSGKKFWFSLTANP